MAKAPAKKAKKKVTIKKAARLGGWLLRGQKG